MLFLFTFFIFNTTLPSGFLFAIDYNKPVPKIIEKIASKIKNKIHKKKCGPFKPTIHERITGLVTYQTAIGIELRWDENPDIEVDHYIIFRTPKFSDGKHKIVLEDENFFLDTDVSFGRKYMYIVRAVDEKGRMSIPAIIHTKYGYQEKTVSPYLETTMSFNNQIEIYFPVGSVSQEILASISISTNKIKTEDFTTASPIYDLSPSGTVFNIPVTVTLKYDATKIPSGMNESDIKIFLRESADSSWKLIEITSIDTNTDTVTCKISSFSEITAGFVSGPGDSQTRFNVNTKLPEFKIPDPLTGKTKIAPPDANISGTLVQSIPIILPPGKQGLTPNLSLQYSSDSKNGLCGVGWDIAKDYISRSTENGIPKYDGSDKFLYNGQELVLTVDNGTYKEYRLVKEGSYLRFRYYIASDYWDVMKDGTTSIYSEKMGGKSLTGTTGTYKWYTTSRDNGHASIDYFYTTGYNGKTELDEIKYLEDNTGLSDYLIKIKFNYENRPDINYNSSSGINIKQDKRLSSIEAFYQGNKVKNYKLNYISSEANDSMLRNVSEYYVDGAVENLANSIDLNYNNFDYSFSSAFATWNQTIAEEDFRKKFIDINGDGKSDIVCYMDGVSGYNNGAFKVYTNSGNGFVFDSVYKMYDAANNPVDLTIDRINFVDVNNDGKPDIIGNYTGLENTGVVFKIFLNDGNGKFILQANNFTADIDQARVGFNDMDGDGRNDVLVNKYGMDTVT